MQVSPSNGPICPKVVRHFSALIQIWENFHFVLENEVIIDCIPQIDSCAPTGMTAETNEPKAFSHIFSSIVTICAAFQNGLVPDVDSLPIVGSD